MLCAYFEYFYKYSLSLYTKYYRESGKMAHNPFSPPLYIDIKTKTKKLMETFDYYFYADYCGGLFDQPITA